MIDLALDPSETRAPAPGTPQRRPLGRILLFGVLGLAGTGAFASVTSTYLSGLAGPRRAPVAIRQKAADWPDLKDGLPTLATGNLPAAAKVHEAPPTEPVLRLEAAVLPGPLPAPVVAAGAARSKETKPDIARIAGALPVIVDVPVIGPARQASLVVPGRTVSVVAPLAAETIRARTGEATFAALPAELARIEAAKPEATKAKPRIETHARPPTGEKAMADQSAARKPATVEAKAMPVEAAPEDEDTEVFGIKMPSLAPAGRKIRESVDALGEAVKALPDRF